MWQRWAREGQQLLSSLRWPQGTEEGGQEVAVLFPSPSEKCGRQQVLGPLPAARDTLGHAWRSARCDCLEDFI